MAPHAKVTRRPLTLDVPLVPESSTDLTTGARTEAWCGQRLGLSGEHYMSCAPIASCGGQQPVGYSKGHVECTNRTDGGCLEELRFADLQRQ